MINNFSVFLSNRLEFLYELLKISLFKTDKVSPPFKRRLIIVYGPAMQNWLLFRMAKDPDLRVATGIEVIHINQAFQQLLTKSRKQTAPPIFIPSSTELALAIEQKIHHFICKFESMGASEREEWAPLVKYAKKESRILTLSHQLSHLFHDYGRYGGVDLLEWEKNPSGWQQRLWQSLFHESTWSYFYREFQKPFSTDPNLELHFFSLSFISENEWKFLYSLSQNTPINYYLLSPCAMFWSDIRSDRECSFLLNQWQKKVNNSSELTSLEDLLSDRNPLLANFGRLGREMIRQIEESSVQISAQYILESSAKELSENESHEDLIYLDSGRPLTLLQAIQADILLMRNPAQHPVLDLKADNSIQVHLSHNKRREIESLYHTLMGLIDAQQPHLAPGEIIVMAPDIMEYTPYIESVFGSSESSLDFQILDVTPSFKNDIFQAFFDLLSLGESRWEASKVLQLFSRKSFQRQHQISAADYELIKNWMERSGIRWGENLSHRNEILRRDHCTFGMVDDSATGTWHTGFNRLLLELTRISQLEFSQSELLGKWIKLIRSLRDDLTPLMDGSKLTLSDWMNYFHCLLEAYFSFDRSLSESVNQYQELKTQLDQLKLISGHFKEELFSYQSVKIHLMNLLQKRKVVYRENHLHAIRFCSMIPLRLIPAKVIAMIGMKEESFPRIPEASSLNILDSGYIPLSNDADRHLFLEVLQSARNQLILSYSGYDLKDHREVQPSLVIQELLAYLDKYYSVGGLPPSKNAVFRHPYDSHHASYFETGSSFRSYFLTDYNAAKASLSKTRLPPRQFIESFNDPKRVTPAFPAQLTIDLKKLSSVAKNPIKFHLNDGLGIYLDKQEDRQIKDNEDFKFSGLDSYLIKQAGLKEPFDTLRQKIENRENTPSGLFKTVAVDDVEKEIAEIHQRLHFHGLSIEELFQIEFSTAISKPLKSESGNWSLPAITLHSDTNEQIKIVGKLSHVSSKGLVCIGKETLPEIWKNWPSYLLFHYAASHYPEMNLEKSQKQLILTDGNKALNAFFVDSEPYIKSWLEYTSLCMGAFSPLMPDWIPFILNADSKGLKNKWKQTFSDFSEKYQSPELRWVFHKDRMPDADLLIQNWKDYGKMGPDQMLN